MYRQKTRFQPSVLVKRSEQEKAPRLETPGCLQPSPLMQSQETPGQAASAQPCNPQLHHLGGAGGEQRGCEWMMIADWDWMEPSDQRAPERFAWPPVLGCWLRQAVLPTWEQSLFQVLSLSLLSRYQLESPSGRKLSQARMAITPESTKGTRWETECLKVEIT